METSVALRLNLDVILEIMAFLPSLTPLMCTCRILYNAAIPLLLRHIDFPFEHPFTVSKIKGFCDFCNTDLLTRCPLIKTFSIYLSTFNDSHKLALGPLVGDISTILSHASNLESLTMTGGTHYWMREYSSLGDAIASRTDLKILRCSGSLLVAKAIARMKSPLTTVEIYTGVGVMKDVEDVLVLPIICTFHHTLTDLSISHLIIEHINCVFSSVSKLTVWRDWKDIEVDQLVRIFPNVNNLTLCTQVEGCTHYEDKVVTYTGMRSKNLNTQTGTRGIGYTSLGYLCGHPTSLYILALTCPVRHLRFTEMLSSFHLNLARGRSVIEAARPTHLTIEVPFEDAIKSDMHTLLREATTSAHFTHLTTVIRVRCEGSGNYRLEVAMNHLITGVLSQSNLKYIHLLYKWTPLPGSYDTQEELDSWLVTIYLKQLEFSAVARSLASRIPSLRYIVLEIVAHADLGVRRGPAYFETILPAGSAVSGSVVGIREVSAGEGQRIIKAAGEAERLPW